MGIYLNPGNENYRSTLKGRVFVDKTMMLARLNQYIEEGNKYICVSRPRRFGKTIASNTSRMFRWKKGIRWRAAY